MRILSLCLVGILLGSAGCGDSASPQPDAQAGDLGSADVAVGDASSGTCAAAFAGCSTFDDQTANNQVQVAFGGGFGNVYQPKCLRVRQGTTVTFQGDFDSHPLMQSCGPQSGLISMPSGSGAAPFVMNTVGTFGYYCGVHGAPDGSGMAGVIDVVP